MYAMIVSDGFCPAATVTSRTVRIFQISFGLGPVTMSRTGFSFRLIFLPITSTAETWICPNASLTDSVGDVRSLPVATATVRLAWCNQSLSHDLCPVRITLGSTGKGKQNMDTPVHLTPSTDADQASLSWMKSCSISTVRRARESFEKVLHDTIRAPTGTGVVAQWHGSNIAVRGFMCTRYNSVVGELDDPAQKSRSNP